MKDFKIKTLIELLNDKLSYANLEYKFVDMVQVDDGNERTLCLVSDRPDDELDIVAVDKMHSEDELTEMLWSILHRIDNLIELLRIYDQFKSNRLEIDLNNLSGTCVREQYYRGYYNVSNITIHSDEHGLNMKLTRKFPYETMRDSIKTCHVRTPDCESKEFSSSTVEVHSDNFQTVIRLLTQQVMQAFQTSEFRKQLQNKNGH